ncbi:hypothetical protein V6Z12_D10G148700 [Gossypium hirsutum]
MVSTIFFSVKHVFVSLQLESVNDLFINPISIFISLKEIRSPNGFPVMSTESQQAICGEEVCGNVTIPSPFGIHSRCYSRSWFRVSCRQTHKGEKPFISINDIDLELLGSLFQDTILIKNPVSYVNCDHKGEVGNSTVNLTGTPFFFSSDYNYFGSVGCGNLATIFSNEADPLGGCIQPICGDGASESGCNNRISGNFTSNVVNMTAMYPTGKDDDKRCASAFIFSRLYFREDYPLPIGIHIETTHVPATLSWNSTYCGDAVICNKTSNGRKMPFLNINGINLEILDFSFLYGNVVVNHSITYFNCRQNNNDGMSLNLTGTPFYYSDFDNPEKVLRICFLESNDFNVNNWTYIPTSLQWSTTPISGLWHLRQGLNTTCSSDREYCWQSLSSTHLCVCNKDFGIGGFSTTVKKVKLFTSMEIEKATDYYNENRILGQGGQGTVYKGMLTDGSIVAIKKSKMVEGKNFDEKKVKQFINEVIILSQVNHRNVVKLLGCCLEAEVPLLVYEFIPNGTLYNLIHSQNEEFPLTWEMRLRIGIEIANAVFYLHSAASAKVSDFETSRSIALEQTHLTTRVQGTFGYMDPEYFRSSQFTEQSDVYSFGVVLVELLTGQKPIPTKQSEEGNSLFDILDSRVVNDGPEKEIIEVAKLAKRCLNLNGKKRLTMKRVAMELELIKASKEDNVIEGSGDEESETDDIIESGDDIASYSITESFEIDSETVPLNSSF